MTTFYTGPKVLITDEVFVLRQPIPARHRIADLRGVHVDRGHLHPARLVAGNLAGAVLITVAISWPFMHSALAMVIACGAALVGLIACAICWRLTPRTYRLLAGDTLLFETADATAFGQVKRGLGRALDTHARAGGQLVRPGLIHTEL
jgi:hypothetical protein